MLPQALHQLGDGLLASLTAYHVYDEGADPTVNADLARSYRMQACEHAAQIAWLVDYAQSLISQQGCQ